MLASTQDPSSSRKRDGMTINKSSSLTTFTTYYNHNCNAQNVATAHPDATSMEGPKSAMAEISETFGPLPETHSSSFHLATGLDDYELLDVYPEEPRALILGEDESMSLSDSMLPRTQREDAAPLQCHPASVLDRQPSSTILASLSDSRVPDTQCRIFSSLEIRNVSGRGADLHIPDIQPPKIASSIKEYFQASKYFAGSDSSLPDTQSPAFSPTTKPTQDDELPETQPQLSPSISQLESEEVPCRQSHRRFTSSAFLSDDYLPATQVSGSFVAKTIERGGPPDGVPSNTPSEIFSVDSVERLDLTAISPTFQWDISNTHSLPALQSSPASQAGKSLDDHLPETQTCTQEAQCTDGRPLPFFFDPQISSSTSVVGKIPWNKVACKERKRIIVSPNRPPNVTKAMRQWVSNTNWLLDPFREDNDCWLHPSPPPARLHVSGVFRPVGCVQKRFAWSDKDGKHSIYLNYGIVVKLINYKMTKHQQDGFINKQWHLSHLCGNWTCLNPAHTTVEPGRTNISRNTCFSHRSGCLHTPKCLKDKKVALGADGKLAYHSDHFTRDIQTVGWLDDDDDDWSGPLLLDDEEDIIMDDFEDLESVGPDDMEAAHSDWSADGEMDVVEPPASDCTSILPV
ncbi:hypothetical protein BKA61DRAFT_139384 [Leptodontidium sp. MPI-SDFR-AT-0119]|nr:hypothetical protein BKA61DRAFT_139384 [Leptodontidium sp. MPI-SDFR-AT-0119]